MSRRIHDYGPSDPLVPVLCVGQSDDDSRVVLDEFGTVFSSTSK